MTEKIGLQAIWDNTQFIKGQTEYMKKMMEAQKATTTTASSMSSMGSSGGAVSGVLGSISNALGISTGQLIGLAGGLAIAKGAFDLISGAVSSFANFMFKGADSALMVASRVEQLNLIAQTLAQNQGMSGEAVNTLVGNLNKLGISLGVSNYLVAQFSRMQLDLGKATDIARVAQDAATISNEGSSDALEGLIYGIQTLNIRILRTHGILVDSDAAYKRYAEANQIAGRELSTTEKQQAMLNEVIAQGASVAGAYEASMLTAGKQLGSMTSRVLPDLKAALGAPFQAGFYNMVKGFNDVLDSIRSMVTEGGVLYPLMVQIGAAFQLITEPIRMFGAALKENGGQGLADFGNTIMSYINAAFNWGVNLVTNFATGMINGASTAITAAINYIAGMLSSWFAPGSPPAVAPDIDVWGSDAMDEYLEGFTEADFNILKNIQTPMKAAFASLAGMGDITAQAAQEMYASFSQEFITAMAEGNVTQELFDQLAAAGGTYGDELAAIAAKQYELATASNLVKDAQEGLDAARIAGAAAMKAADEEVEAAREKYDQTVADGDKAVQAADEAAEAAREKYDATVLAGEKAIEDATKKRDKASADVTKGLQEYNQLVRGGASKEVLAAKLKEINAAKAIERSANQEILDKTEAAKVAEEAAKAEVDAADEVKKTTQEAADAAKALAQEEVDAAEERAKQIKENADAAIAAEQAKVDAAKDNLKVLQDQEALLEMQLQTLIDINKAQEEAWRLAHPITPTPTTPTPTPPEPPGGGGAPELPDMGGVTGGFDPDKIVNPLRDAVNKAAADMKAKIIAAWNTIKVKVQAAWMIAMANIKKALKNSGLLEKWDAIKKAAIKAWNAIKKEVKDIIFWLKRWWATYGGDIVGYFRTAWENVKKVVAFFMPVIRMYVKNLFAAIKLIVTVGWAVIKGIFKVALTLLGGAFKVFNLLMKGKWEEAWDAIKDTFSKVWRIIKQAAITIWNAFKKYFEEVLDNLKEFWDTTWGKVLAKAKEIWENIKNEIKEKIEAARDKIKEVSDTIKERWEDFWDAVKQKAQDIWDAIKTYIKDKIEEARDKIKEVSDTIKERWEDFWDAVKQKAQDIWDAIKQYIQDKIEAARDKIQEVSDTIKESWKTFWDAVKLKATEIWDAIKLYVETKIDAIKLYIDTVTTNIKTAWDTFWDAVKLKATEIWDAVKTYIETKYNEIKDFFVGSESITAQIKSAWDTFWNAVQTKATEIWSGENGIKTKIDNALTTIKGYFGSVTGGDGFLGTVMNRWDTAWTNFKAKVIGIWDGEDGIKSKVQAAIDWFKGLFTNAQGTGMIDRVSTWATDIYNGFKSLGSNVASGIAQGISDGWRNLGSGLSALVNKILNIIKNLLGIGSPSKVMAGIGKQMMKGMDIGIRAHAVLPKDAMMDAMLPITRSASVPITQGTSNYYQPNINMVNNINNGMSVPYLQALIIRTVKKGMTA